MQRIVTTAFLFLLCWGTGSAQITRTKIIDGGGSGPYAAVAVTEATLPDFTVYRPEDLRGAASADGGLPTTRGQPPTS